VIEHDRVVLVLLTPSQGPAERDPMAAYLITYDLKDRKYEKALLDYVRETEGAEMVTESSYVAITNDTADQIKVAIRQITNDQAHVYVFPVTSCVGYGKESVNDWLTKNGL